MSRTVLAFLIAPLWITLAGAILAKLTFPGQDPWMHFFVITGTALGYVPTWLVGLPAFRILRALNYISLGLALVLGFVIGALTWVGFVTLLYAYFLGSVLSFSSNWIDLICWLLATGALGSLVGATIWLIAD